MKIQNIRLLSTKILPPEHKKLLDGNQIALTEADFIQISYRRLPDELDVTSLKNAVFTSQNAVKGLLENLPAHHITIQNIYCVGTKTAGLLKENGFPITFVSDTSFALATHIATNTSVKDLVFFCGNLRNDALPDILGKNKVHVREIQVYRTMTTPLAIENNFHGILFFSPSAVRSYHQKNKIKKSVAFCIGSTTASAAQKHTNNIVVATQPTIEQLLKQAISYFNQTPAP